MSDTAPMPPEPGVTTSRSTKRVRPRGYIAEYRPKPQTLALLDAVALVLEEYREYWPLTCRQIFYRFVSTRAAYPKTERFYHTLTHHIANARRGRRIEFDAIRDDGADGWCHGHFEDEEDFLRHVRELGEKYRRNKLSGQDRHIEVWCEAQGMWQQLLNVAGPYSIDVYSSGGFDSLTAKKKLSERICSIGKRAVILHLGDFDPSGVSIFDSVAEDVAAFVKADRPWATIDVEFRRVALTEDQVQAHKLPTAPPKPSDGRSKRWTGETCQIEALPPNIIAGILKDAIVALIDHDQLARDCAQEAIDRRRIALALPAPMNGGAQ